MKKNGFTLIELMIVIAIIGIIMGCGFFDGIKFLSHRFKHDSKIVSENTKLCFMFSKIKRILEKENEVIDVEEDGHCVNLSKERRIRVSPNGKNISIVDSNGELNYNFKDTWFSKFRKIDNKTFYCKIKFRKMSLPMYWKVGNF